jgi:hypothetical protein
MPYRVATFAFGLLTVVLAYNYFAAGMVDVSAITTALDPAAAPSPAPALPPGRGRNLLAERYITSSLYIY